MSLVWGTSRFLSLFAIVAIAACKSESGLSDPRVDAAADVPQVMEQVERSPAEAPVVAQLNSKERSADAETPLEPIAAREYEAVQVAVVGEMSVGRSAKGHTKDGATSLAPSPPKKVASRPNSMAKVGTVTKAPVAASPRSRGQRVVAVANPISMPATKVNSKPPVTGESIGSFSVAYKVFKKRGEAEMEIIQARFDVKDAQIADTEQHSVKFGIGPTASNGQPLFEADMLAAGHQAYELKQHSLRSCPDCFRNISGAVVSLTLVTPENASMTATTPVPFVYVSYAKTLQDEPTFTVAALDGKSYANPQRTSIHAKNVPAQSPCLVRHRLNPSQPAYGVVTDGGVAFTLTGWTLPTEVKTSYIQCDFARKVPVPNVENKYVDMKVTYYFDALETVGISTAPSA